MNLATFSNLAAKLLMSDSFTTQPPKHLKGLLIRFAFIDFVSHKSVAAALGFNGKIVDGRDITVDIETTAPRPQYKVKLSPEGNTKYNAEFFH